MTPAMATSDRQHGDAPAVALVVADAADDAGETAMAPTANHSPEPAEGLRAQPGRRDQRDERQVVRVEPGAGHADEEA